MSRLPPLSLENMTPEQREMYDAFVERRTRAPKQRSEVYKPMQVPTSGLGGPFEPWLRNPALFRRVTDLGGVLRFSTSLPARLTELAILVVARDWTAQFEWFAHERMARSAGVPDAVIEAIQHGREPALEDADDEAVYRFATELLRERRVSDATYAQLRERIGEEATVDLVTLLGYYTLVSMTLNVFEVPLPDGAKPPLR